MPPAPRWGSAPSGAGVPFSVAGDAGVEGVAEPVAEEVEGEERCGEGDAGEEEEPGELLHGLLEVHDPRLMVHQKSKTVWQRL